MRKTVHLALGPLDEDGAHGGDSGVGAAGDEAEDQHEQAARQRARYPAGQPRRRWLKAGITMPSFTPKVG
jgi:hypothetical protein